MHFTENLRMTSWPPLYSHSAVASWLLTDSFHISAKWRFSFGFINLYSTVIWILFFLCVAFLIAMTWLFLFKSLCSHCINCIHLLLFTMLNLFTVFLFFWLLPKKEQDNYLLFFYVGFHFFVHTLELQFHLDLGGQIIFF